MSARALEAALQETLEREVAGRGLPGVDAAVTVAGELVWTGAAGVADLETGRSLAAGSCFPAYSITKTMTAACALRLGAAGRLELDATADRWLAGIPLAERVTLRQLLAHTAGVFNYSALPAYHEAVRKTPGEPWSFEEFVARTCDRPLDFEPGVGFGYSNTGYTLVRRILERIAGASFAELIDEHVAAPLRLTRTRVLEDLSDMRALVPGHSELFSAPGEPRDVRSVYHPGWCGTGLVASTAAELCAFYDALFAGTLIDDAALAEMLVLRRVPGEHPPAVTPSYGLGIMGDPDGAQGREYGHGGGGPGWNLRATHWTDFSGPALSMAVLCNHDADVAWEITIALADAATGALQ